MKKNLFLAVAFAVVCSSHAEVRINNLSKNASLDDSLPEEYDSTRLQKLDEVVVQAYRMNQRIKDVPNKIEIITKEDMQVIPSENLTDIIKKTTGANSVEMPGLAGGVDFRGFAPSAMGTNAYSLILVDGMPAATKNASAVSLTNIRNIEVLQGPFSALFGSGAMGGVINLISPRSTGKVKGGASFSYGSWQTVIGKLDVGGSIGEKFNFDLYADLFNQGDDYKTGSHNLLGLDSDEKKVMDPKAVGKTSINTKYSKYAFGARLGYDVSPNWKVDLFNDFFLTGQAQSNGSFWGIYGELGKTIARHYHRLDVKGDLGKHQLRIAPYYSNEHSEYNNGLKENSFKESVYNYKTYGILLSDAVRFGDHMLMYGADSHTQQYDSKQFNSTGQQTAPYQPDYLNSQNSLFAQGSLSFLDNRLTAIAGLRYDMIVFKTFVTPFMDVKNSSKTHHTVNPNVGVKFKITPELSVRSSFGTAFLAPDAFKLTGEYSYNSAWGSMVYKGNPNLKPEKSSTLDIGAEYISSNRTWNLGATFFYTYHSDIIGYDYANPEYVTFLNANHAKTTGLELNGSVDFGALLARNYSLRLYANYTHLLDATVYFDGGTTHPKRYVPKDNLNFGLTYQWSGLTASFNGRYIGRRYDDNFVYAYDYVEYKRVPYYTPDNQPIRPDLINEDVIRLPDFLLFDINVDYRFKNRIGVGLKIANLFDENYMERDSYYLPGRSFMGTVSYRF